MSKLDSTQGPSIKRVFCPSGVSFEAVNVIQRDTVDIPTAGIPYFGAKPEEGEHLR